MSVKAVIDIARADLGYTESPPNSNKTKYGEWYGMNGQPWCVMALAYWFNQAGERMAFFGGGKTASCGTLLMWYQNMGQTVPVEQVQVGDIVILNFHGTKDTEHCGLVVAAAKKNDPAGETVMSIYTVEGNTTNGNGSQDNGGAVCEKIRYRSQIVAVCRPQYKAEAKPVDDVTGHWAEDAIRWCKAHGIMEGYPDGTFLPDKPVTRAELATVLRRLDVGSAEDVIEKAKSRIRELEARLAVAQRFDEDRII